MTVASCLRCQTLFGVSLDFPGLFLQATRSRQRTAWRLAAAITTGLRRSREHRVFPIGGVV